MTQPASVKSSQTCDAVGTVYYDGQCPLCSKEIAHLQNKVCPLEFVDAHSDAPLPQHKAQLLEQLHVVTSTGQTLVGLDANIFMWRNSRNAWLATFFSLPVVYFVAKRVYALWAKKRYQKMYGV